MNLKLKFYSYFCTTEEFEINGIKATPYDFVEQYDELDTINAGKRVCINMLAIRLQVSDEILEKYKITIEEYHIICDLLEDGLSFGKCNLCK
jgi:hypothetical protein